MKNLLLLLPTIVMTLSAKSVYEYDLKSIDGDATNLTEHKGKVILMVNVASRCGFTSRAMLMTTLDCADSSQINHSSI